MPAWMLAFSLGIVLAGFAPALPPVHWLPVGLLPALLGLRWPLLRLSGAYALGLVWALWQGHVALADRLPQVLERQDIWLEGQISSLPRQSERSTRFRFDVQRWCPQASLEDCDFQPPPVLRRSVLLSHYGTETFAPGQRWRFQVRLRRPHGLANPGGFDYEAWLLQQGYSAVGYVRDERGNRLLGDLTLPGFEGLRHRARQALAAAEEGRGLEHGALILALGIADGDAISAAQWELFAATGTVHIIVVSGMHIGLAAWLGYQSALGGLRLARWQPRRLPLQRLAALAGLLAGFCYAGLAGFSLPVQRALAMLIALMLGRLLGRQSSASANLCLALGVILCFDPLAPQNAGFWLSFVAVALLLHCLPRRPAAEDGQAAGKRGRVQGPWRGLTETLRRGAARQSGPTGGLEGSPARRSLLSLTRWRAEGQGLLLAQWVMFAGLLPFLALFFQQLSLAAPLVNLLAIPFTSFLVVPLCLLGLALLPLAPLLAGGILLAADRLLGVYLAFLEASLRWLPLGLVELPNPGPAGRALLLVACLAWVLPLRWRWRLPALTGLLPLCLAGPEPLPDGQFRLHLLDVGQGLAAVVETAQHALVFDTGPRFSANFDAGEAVLLPFLRARNRRTVDRVLLSHGDSDHAGGLAALVARFPHADYLAGETAPGLPAQARPCRQGERWHWDGVEFELLHPDREYRDSNAVSCVLRISAGAQSALLTGDIEARAEARLLRELPDKLRADLLVAAHHGSRTSSTPAFVAAVRPQHVVYSSGYLNRFNHPHPEVQARFQTLGAQAWHTAASGSLSFLLGGGAAVAAPQEWRRVRRRFWSTPPPRPEEGSVVVK